MLNGLYTEWYKNGQKKLDCNYENNEKHGSYNEWHENGNKKTSGTCYHNEKDELWVLWDEMGRKSNEQYYEDGVLKNSNPLFHKDLNKVFKKNINPDTEQVVEYYKSGQKEVEYTTSKGLRNGVIRVFYKTGNLKIQGFFRNDKREGDWISWYENGQKKVICNFEKNMMTGLLTRWDEDGNTLEEIIYDNGIPQT